MAEVSMDGAVTEGSLASHHCLQAQRKEVRGPVVPGSPTHVISPGGPRDCPWGPTGLPLGAHVICPGGPRDCPRGPT